MSFYCFNLYYMHFISISIAYCSCRLIAAVLANKLFSTGLFMLLVLLGQSAYSKAKTTKKTDSMCHCK